MHWLTPLLNPASIAVVGASTAAGSVGCATAELLQNTGYGGSILAVNPR